jgi:glycosyltransferase involved in cell wall biosynthesis
MDYPKSSVEKIKVLRIIARLNIGGPAIHTILLSSHLERFGYQTLLVAGQVGSEEGDMNYLANSEGVEPVIISRLGRRLLPLSDLVAFLSILRLLFSWRPHIVHTHTAKAGAVGRVAAAVYNGVQTFKFKVQSWVHRFSRGSFNNTQASIINERCKVVHTFHGHVLHGYFSNFKSRLFKLIEKILAKCTDVIVVVSEQQREELCTKFGVGRPGQYQVVPLGLDLSLFKKASESRGKLRSDFGLTDNGGNLVGTVGRLTAIKNNRLFLESISALRKENNEIQARFLIVGDGELRSDLEGMTKDLELVDRVIFTGWIRDLASLYANLNVLAVTSDNEGTPVALIEAMAASVPVIATDVGGVRELISDFARPPRLSEQARDGGQGLRPPARRGLRPGGISDLSEEEFEICERGVLVRKGDVKGLAKGLKYLLEHPEERREMGRRGQEYVIQNHTVDRLATDMDKLYKSLLPAGDK